MQTNMKHTKWYQQPLATKTVQQYQRPDALESKMQQKLHKDEKCRQFKIHSVIIPGITKQEKRLE